MQSGRAVTTGCAAFAFVMTTPQQPLSDQELAELREALPVLRAIQALIRAGAVDRVAPSAIEPKQSRRKIRPDPSAKPGLEHEIFAERWIRKNKR